MLRMKGGYYPSAMGAILRSGPVFIASAITTALKLIHRNDERLKARKARGATFKTTHRRKPSTRKVKRTSK